MHSAAAGHSSAVRASPSPRARLWHVAVCVVAQHSLAGCLQTDPTRFLSGSDDGTVRLWNMSDESAVACIDSKANVCSVQFCPNNSNLMVFGSANYRVYLYDLRQVRSLAEEWLFLGASEADLRLLGYVGASKTGPCYEACVCCFSLCCRRRHDRAQAWATDVTAMQLDSIAVQQFCLLHGVPCTLNLSLKHPLDSMMTLIVDNGQNLCCPFVGTHPSRSN